MIFVAKGNKNLNSEGVFIMKKQYRFLSLFLAIGMLISVFGTMMVSAADFSGETTTITQFSYVVFDQNGNIIESGITPDFRTRYSWSGITLDNGYGVALRRTDGSGFYATQGTRLEYDYTLDRAAHMEHTIGFAENPTGDPGWKIWHTSESYAKIGGLSVPARQTGYQMFFMYNLSSDPVTLTNVSLVF